MASSQATPWQPSRLHTGTSIVHYLYQLRNRVECTLSKFAEETKLSGAVDTLEERGAIQRELDRLEKWTRVNFMKFKKAKGNILHLGRAIPGISTECGMSWLRAALQSRTWGHWWMKIWTWASNVCLQPIKPIFLWTASKEARPAGQGRRFSSLPHSYETPHGVLCAGPRPPAQGRERHVRAAPGEGCENDQRSGTPSGQKGWESWSCSVWRREGSRGPYCSLSVLKGGCGALTLVDYQVPTKSLYYTPSSTGQKENTSKGLWVKIRIGRSLSNYCHGKNRLYLWKCI